VSCLALSGRRQPSLPRPDPKGRRALELRDDVLRDGVTLVFGQAFLQAANDFAGTPKRKGEAQGDGFSPGKVKPKVRLPSFPLKPAGGFAVSH
jgi:hypothetical protein